MKYCIITEEQEIFKVERIFMGTKKELVFANIEEETKYEQLEYAALIRFNSHFITSLHNNNQVFSLTNCSKWLKLIPQSDYNNTVDLPSLSLMA